jgi:hypothetical protein
MTAKHISDGRQRRSAKYIALHAQLRKEAREGKSTKSPKQFRKFARSELFRACAERP